MDLIPHSPASPRPLTGRVAPSPGGGALATRHRTAAVRRLPRLAAGVGLAATVGLAAAQSQPPAAGAPVPAPPAPAAVPSASAASAASGSGTAAPARAAAARPVPAALPASEPSAGTGGPALVGRPATALPSPDLQPTDAWPARALVALFVDGCVAHEGAVQPVVDWAITQGFVPIDAEDPGARALLDDRPGTVLSPPGLEGRIVLAVVDKVHCVVWTDRAGGPSLRLAMLQALADRRARGDRVEPDLDRKVERAGAWRQQTQWRWRRVGGSGEHGIGLVHTLTDTPAAQVMRLAPLSPQPAYAPDGVPTRGVR